MITYYKDIDKIIASTNRSAYAMQVAINNICIFFKNKDAALIKAILAIKDDQNEYLLDKVILKNHFN